MWLYELGQFKKTVRVRERGKQSLFEKDVDRRFFYHHRMENSRLSNRRILFGDKTKSMHAVVHLY
ncbi:hypothetical protein GCM10023310_53940 [Paenibacillus vulneris]